LKTTTIGAYPKPSCIPLSDWFKPGVVNTPTERYDSEIEAMGEGAESLFVEGAAEVIADQVAAGVDVVTDGEVRRENYVHYHCRHLNDISFERLTETSKRSGSYQAHLPTITGPVSAGEPFLPHDWRAAQALTDRPVKTTLPGPMTIGDTVADDYYDDPRSRGADLAAAINREVLALAEAGCRHIQIDEPLFARHPEQALDFGIEHLERCFHGVPSNVATAMHMCCGYPDRLDNPDYPKAPADSYHRLADALDAAQINAISIEDAHRHLDLKLLERFGATNVILGVVDIASSRVEGEDEIHARLTAALDHIDRDRLIAAPDCGMGLLSRDQARAKLRNMCAAAGRFRE